MLKKWDASRSIKRDTIYRSLSLGHKRQLLARIAAGTFAYNQILIPQDGLVKLIDAYIQNLPLADKKDWIDGESMLRSIEAQHGLLIERAHQIYSFSHLTFHEYFTARYIVEHPSTDIFRSVVRHIHDIRWREILLLTASLLDDLNANMFFDAFDTALRVKIQKEYILLELFDWIYRKSESNKHLRGCIFARYIFYLRLQ